MFRNSNQDESVTKRSAILLFVLGVLVSIGQVQAAPMLYGIRGDWGNRNADLITIDAATGELDSVIGWTGMTGVGGFAVNPLDGTLYAAGGGDYDGTPGLHTLDPTTGAATFVGGGVRISDMGFDSSGTLYAVMAYRGVGPHGELATIDLTTGGFTPIGGSFIGGIGLAFDSSDTLYVKSRNLLHTVDPQNGDILTTTVLDNYLRNSLTFDENDVLYSHTWGPTSVGDWIVTIDPISGITTPLGQIPENSERAALSALDFGPEPTSFVLVDIKPGSSPNSVNLRSQGLLPVAILSTDEFDVSDVDIDSLLFGDPLLIDNGGTAVTPLRNAFEDVSGDGFLDLTLKFSIADLVEYEALGPDTIEGLLTGALLDGTPIAGMDSIRIVPPNGSNGNGIQNSAVPESSALALTVIGLLGIGLRRRKRA